MKKILLGLFLLFSLKGISQAVIATTGNVAPAGNFPAFYDEHFKGGYRVVADTNARNAIPQSYRKDLMLVGDTTTHTVWLLDSSRNPMWVAFGGGVSIDTTEIAYKNRNNYFKGGAIWGDSSLLPLLYNCNSFPFIQLRGGTDSSKKLYIFFDDTSNSPNGLQWIRFPLPNISSGMLGQYDTVAYKSWVEAQGYSTVGGYSPSFTDYGDGTIGAESVWYISGSDGHVYFDEGNITSDGSGNIVVSTVYNGQDESQMASQNWVNSQGFAYDWEVGGGGYSPSFTDEGNGWIAGDGWALQGTAGSALDNGAFFTDGDGNVTLYTLTVGNNINGVANWGIGTIDGGAYTGSYFDGYLIATDGWGNLSAQSFNSNLMSGVGVSTPYDVSVSFDGGAFFSDGQGNVTTQTIATSWEDKETWQLGGYATGSVTVSTNSFIQVAINGNWYKLAVCTNTPSP